jgi:hypothetical protein
MLLKILNGVARCLWWIFWEFSGIHYIFHKCNPKEPKSDKPPVAAGLWIIGIYIALFGLASQRYENRIGIVETRIGTIITVMSTYGFKQAVAGIPNTQKMLCPEEPALWNPIATIKSLFGFSKPYGNGVELLKETLEKWKASLSEVDLAGADLSRTDLSDAKLKGANLFLADLRRATLRGADLSSACLRQAHLDSVDCEGAKLEEADLREAHLDAASLGSADLNGASLVGANLTWAHLEATRLVGADLSDACLTEARLAETDLREADLRGAKVTVNQLLEAASLYKTTLDAALLMKIKEKAPEVFAKIYNTTTNQYAVDPALLEQIKMPDWMGWHEGH